MQKKDLELATFGAGCFWCIEAIFQDLEGVHSVVSGYTGGIGKNPTYREICSGLSGHAEVAQIQFDPAIISFEDLVKIFFTTHDPTTLNRQGADVGTQYRSVIYYHNEAQKVVAEEMKGGFATSIWKDPIVTEISEYTEMYRAESYHQNYYKDNPYDGYCQIVINPKVRKFRQMYADKLKKQYIE